METILYFRGIRGSDSCKMKLIGQSHSKGPLVKRALERTYRQKFFALLTNQRFPIIVNNAGIFLK